MDYQEEAQTLEGIQRRIAGELEDAENIIRRLRGENNPKAHLAGERAYQYWYPTMRSSIDNESGFVGSPMFVMQDTIDELNKLADGQKGDDKDGDEE